MEFVGENTLCKKRVDAWVKRKKKKKKEKEKEKTTWLSTITLIKPRAPFSNHIVYNQYGNLAMNILTMCLESITILS
jgi:hypothetical protein